MCEKVKLRPLNLKDIEIMQAWPRYQAKSDLWANIALSSSSEGERWITTYHQPPRCYAFAADTAEGLLVGRANIAVLDEPTKVGGIFSFTINPGCTGKGYGQATLDELLRFAFVEQGMSAVYLYTQANNHKARHIYDKFGFQFVGTHYAYKENQGRVKFVDLVVWRATWEQRSFK